MILIIMTELTLMWTNLVTLDWIVLDWIVPGLNRLGLNHLGLNCLGTEMTRTESSWTESSRTELSWDWNVSDWNVRDWIVRDWNVRDWIVRDWNVGTESSGLKRPGLNRPRTDFCTNFLVLLSLRLEAVHKRRHQFKIEKVFYERQLAYCIRVFILFEPINTNSYLITKFKGFFCWNFYKGPYTNYRAQLPKWHFHETIYTEKYH